MRARRGRPLATRVLQGVGAQGLNSLSNFALVVAIARTATPTEFGAFSIAYSIVALAIPVLRSSIGETLAVTDDVHAQRRDAMGAALIAALGVAALLACVAVAVSGPLTLWMVLFVGAAPALILQDTARSIGFALHRPLVAVVSDGTWLAIQAAGWAAAIASGRGTPEVLFLLWVVGAAVGGLAVGRFVGIPSVPGGPVWLMAHRRTTAGFGLDVLMAIGASHATLYAVGLVAGLPAAGALRGAQALYGPVRTVILGVGAVALPEAVHRMHDGREAMVSYVSRVSLWLAAVGLAAVGALSFLPDSVGRQLLDDTWSGASQVMTPIGLTLLGGALIVGAGAGFRALRAVRELLYLRVAAAVASATAGVAGAIYGGLVVAAWSLATVGLAGVAVAWVLLFRTAASPQAASSTRVHR